MKKVAYKFFRRAIYKRALRLSVKQLSRLQRLNKAINYLREHENRLLIHLFPALCSLLKIELNEAAKDFIYGLTFGTVDIEKEARKLPLI